MGFKNNKPIRRLKGNSVRDSKLWLDQRCHICDIGIPNGWQDPNSPLFGTIDHVFPKCLGGRDHPRNLQPAHFLCNQLKGGAVGVSEELKSECREAIATYAGLLGSVQLWDFKENKRLIMYKTIARNWWANRGVQFKTETEAVNQLIQSYEDNCNLWLECTDRIVVEQKRSGELQNRFRIIEDKYLAIPSWIRWFFN